MILNNANKGSSTRGILLCLVLFAALPSTVLAQSSQDGLPAGSWVFDALGVLYAEAGMAAPAIVAPMPRAELRVRLEALEGRELSAAGLALLERLKPLALGAGEAAPLKAHASLSAGLDIRYRSDETLPWSTEPAERPSLLSLPLGFALGDWVAGFADLELREGYWVSTLGSGDLDGDRNWSSLPDTADYLDANIPRRAGLSLGGAAWNFLMARDRIDMGAAELGATTVSRSLDRVDFARLSFFSDVFSWRSMVVQFEPTPFVVSVSDPPATDAPSSTQRYLYLHRADWRPISSLTLGFSEGVLVAQPAELRFLNPIASFHAMSSWKHYGDGDDSVGSLFGLDLGWSPFAGARLYGQLALNQLKTPFPSESGSVQPDAYALILGSEWNKPVGSAYLSVSAEGYYATPWFATLYGRDWSYLASRHELSAPPGYPGDDILSWIGSPYGRDAAVLSLKAEWSEPGLRSLSLEYRFAALGENALDPDATWDSWYENPVDPLKIEENAAMIAPSGTPILDHGAFLRGAMDYESWSLSALVGARLRFTAGHASGSTLGGFEFGLSAVRHIF